MWGGSGGYTEAELVFSYKAEWKNSTAWFAVTKKKVVGETVGQMCTKRARVMFTPHDYNLLLL